MPTAARIQAEPPPQTVTPITRGAIFHRHQLGNVLAYSAGTQPVELTIGRATFRMTADEANSLAIALAKAAADSRRVLL